MNDPESGSSEGERPPAPGPAGPSPAPAHTWERVHERFHEALELDPERREAFLTELGREDPPLAGEVRSLLAAHEASEDFLAESPAARLPHAAVPGDRLGPYRIVEEIARGGMGVVYRAVRDDQSFAREVAIKLIDPGMRSEHLLRRFRAERQILAMLDHPNIARLLDGGTAPDGSPYLVMEYVSGRPLLEYCDARQLNVDERLALFLTVCDAVQFAHQRLVVHRDLKSDNILVGEDGSPRLLDFGIAKLLAPEGGTAPATLTLPVHRMLTPDYASPEQVRGEPVTVAGDVYSLGVVLYELLTGARPLHFKTRTPEEILRVMSHEDPAPPSSVASRSPGGEAATRRRDTTRGLRRRLAGDLDGVVLKALAKDPARRYGSADQLAQDLRRHLEGLPVLARRPSAAYRMSRFVHRHRAGVAAGALVAAALLAGLAGTTWQAGVARRERDRATRRFEEVKDLAHAVMFDLHDAIAPLPGSTRARELLVQQALHYLDGLRAEARGDVELQKELAAAYAKIGDVQGRPMFPNLGRTAEALDSYRKSLDLLREAAAAQPESLSIARNQIVVSQRLGDLLAVMGRHREALKVALESRERVLAEIARHPDERDFLTDLCVAYNRLTDMKLYAGDTLGALAECHPNVALTEHLFRENPKSPGARRGVLIACTKLAWLQALRGEPDSAMASYRRAQGLAREAVAALPHDTDASRDLSIVYGSIGLFFAEQGRIDTALAVYEEGMRISERMAAADPANALTQADVAAGHFEIGTMLMKGRRFRDAERRFDEAFGRYSRLASADTGNADNVAYMARSARQAGEASRSLARGAASLAERSRWRTRAVQWLERSEGLFRTLSVRGGLSGEEVAAPEEVRRMVEELRREG